MKNAKAKTSKVVFRRKCAYLNIILVAASSKYGMVAAMSDLFREELSPHL
jgi:hypothetical protein